MSACIFDHLEQCFKDCSKCVRFSPVPDCKFCGSEDNIYDTDDGYVCEDCLKKIKNKDAVYEFLIEYGDEYQEFLKKWYSDWRIL